MKCAATQHLFIHLLILGSFIKSKLIGRLKTNLAAKFKRMKAVKFRQLPRIFTVSLASLLRMKMKIIQNISFGRLKCAMQNARNAPVRKHVRWVNEVISILNNSTGAFHECTQFQTRWLKETLFSWQSEWLAAWVTDDNTVDVISFESNAFIIEVYKLFSFSRRVCLYLSSMWISKFRNDLWKS